MLPLSYVHHVQVGLQTALSRKACDVALSEFILSDFILWNFVYYYMVVVPL